MQTSRIKVALRVKPKPESEASKSAPSCVKHIPGITQILIEPDRSFTFDYVFTKQDTQQNIYEKSVKPLISQFLEGYNITVMAYGQTGSGKTYTMGTSAASANLDASNGQAGMIPRAFADIYSYLSDKEVVNKDFYYQIEASFIELYNDEINDLLQPGDPSERTFTKTRLNSFLKKGDNSFRKQSAGRSNSISDVIFKTNKSGSESFLWSQVHKLVVNNKSDLYSYLDKGNLNRKIGSTQMNEFSSRSHAIFTITLTQQSLGSTGNSSENSNSLLSNQLRKIVSKIHFVDLAGSERIKDTKSSGKRMQEGISINSGLLALGNVISSLGNVIKRQFHVPYRNSKLTRLLEDSLGGNSLTLMLACVTETKANYSENLSTLRYANRARNIKNKVVISEQKVGNSEIVSLKMQIEQLKTQLENQKNQQQTIALKYGSRKLGLLEHISTITKNEIHQDRIDSNRAGLSKINIQNAFLESRAQSPRGSGNHKPNDVDDNALALAERVEFQDREIRRLENLLRAKHFINKTIVKATGNVNTSKTFNNPLASGFNTPSAETAGKDKPPSTTLSYKEPTSPSKPFTHSKSKSDAEISTLFATLKPPQLDTRKNPSELGHKKNSPSIVASLRSFKTISKYFSKTSDDKTYKILYKQGDQKSIKVSPNLKSPDFKQKMTAKESIPGAKTFFDHIDDKWNEVADIVSDQRSGYLSYIKNLEDTLKNQKKTISNLKKIVEVKSQYEDRAPKYAGHLEIKTSDHEYTHSSTSSAMKFKKPISPVESFESTDLVKSESFKTLLDNYIELCVKASTYYSELDVLMKRQNDLIEFQGNLFSKLGTLEALGNRSAQTTNNTQSVDMESINLQILSLNNKVTLIDAELKYLDASVKLTEQKLADIAIYFKGGSSFNEDNNGASQLAVVENIDKIQYEDFSSITKQLNRDELQYMAFLLCQNILDMKIDLTKTNKEDGLLKGQNFTLQNQIDVIRRVSISVATMYEQEILEIENQKNVTAPQDNFKSMKPEQILEAAEVSILDNTEKSGLVNSFDKKDSKLQNYSPGSRDSEISEYASLPATFRETDLDLSYRTPIDFIAKSLISSKLMVSELDLTIPFFESPPTDNNTNQKRLSFWQGDNDEVGYVKNQDVIDQNSTHSSNKSLNESSFKRRTGSIRPLTDLKYDRHSVSPNLADNSKGKKSPSLSKRNSLKRHVSYIQIPVIMNGGLPNSSQQKNKKSGSFNRDNMDYSSKKSSRKDSGSSISDSRDLKCYSSASMLLNPSEKPSPQPNRTADEKSSFKTRRSGFVAKNDERFQADSLKNNLDSLQNQSKTFETDSPPHQDLIYSTETNYLKDKRQNLTGIFNMDISTEAQGHGNILAGNVIKSGEMATPEKERLQKQSRVVTRVNTAKSEAAQAQNLYPSYRRNSSTLNNFTKNLAQAGIYYNNTKNSSRYSLGSISQLYDDSYKGISGSGILNMSPSNMSNTSLSHHPSPELVQRVKKRGILQSALKIASVVNSGSTKNALSYKLSSSSLFLPDQVSLSKLIYSSKSTLEPSSDTSLVNNRGFRQDPSNSSASKYRNGNLRHSLYNSTDIFKRNCSIDQINGLSTLDSKESLSFYGYSGRFSNRDKVGTVKSGKLSSDALNSQDKFCNRSVDVLNANPRSLGHSSLRQSILSSREFRNSASRISDFNHKNSQQARLSAISATYKEPSVIQTGFNLNEYNRKLQSYSEIYQESKRQLDRVYKTIGANKQGMQESNKSANNFYLMMEVLRNSSSNEELGDETQNEGVGNQLGNITDKIKPAVPKTQANPQISTNMHDQDVLSSSNLASAITSASPSVLLSTSSSTQSLEPTPTPTPESYLEFKHITFESKKAPSICDTSRSVSQKENWDTQKDLHCSNTIGNDTSALTQNSLKDKISPKSNNKSYLGTSAANNVDSLQTSTNDNLDGGLIHRKVPHVDAVNKCRISSSKIVDKILELENTFLLELSPKSKTLHEFQEESVSEVWNHATKAENDLSFDQLELRNKVAPDCSTVFTKKLSQRSNSMPDLVQFSSGFSRISTISAEHIYLKYQGFNVSSASFAKKDYNTLKRAKTNPDLRIGETIRDSSGLIYVPIVGIRSKESLDIRNPGIDNDFNLAGNPIDQTASDVESIFMTFENLQNDDFRDDSSLIKTSSQVDCTEPLPDLKDSCVDETDHSNSAKQEAYESGGDSDVESISGMSNFSMELSDDDIPFGKSKEYSHFNDYIKGSGLASRFYINDTSLSSDYMTPLVSSFADKSQTK